MDMDYPEFPALLAKTLADPRFLETATALVRAYGGDVTFENLADYYGDTEVAVRGGKALYYTGSSDGQKIILHKDTDATASPAYQGFNVLHLAGHMAQWNLSKEQAAGLRVEFYGERARELAVHDFRTTPPSDLCISQRYEIEANRFAADFLKKTLEAMATKPEKIKSVLKDFRVHSANDIDFLTEFYLGTNNQGPINRQCVRGLLSRDQIFSTLRPLSFPGESHLQMTERLPSFLVPVVQGGGGHSTASSTASLIFLAATVAGLALGATKTEASGISQVTSPDGCWTKSSVTEADGTTRSVTDYADRVGTEVSEMTLPDGTTFRVKIPGRSQLIYKTGCRGPRF